MNKKVLKDFSFHLPGKDRIANVGRRTCGKTTILNLLLRFFDPYTGIILIDRQDIRDYNELHSFFLTGLDKFPDLETLTAHDCYVKNLPIREKCEILKTLDLKPENTIDYSFLEKLGNLKRLSIQDNDVQDFSSFEGLISLESLQLTAAGLEDLALLPELPSLLTRISHKSFQFRYKFLSSRYFRGFRKGPFSTRVESQKPHNNHTIGLFENPRYHLFEQGLFSHIMRLTYCKDVYASLVPKYLLDKGLHQLLNYSCEKSG